MSMMTHADSIFDLDADAIVRRTKENSYHVLRGLFKESMLNDAIAVLRQRADQEAEIRPTSGVSPSETMTNMQKWSVGAKSPKDTLGRFFRTIYNPLWCDDIYNMREHFINLIEIRNHLTGMPKDYAKQCEEGDLYTACRLQHYPRGGGFMQAHRDHVAESNLVGTEQSKFIQLVLVCSESGPSKDYETGGAFITDENGKNIMTEVGARPGDILVYDGRTVHGVEDIDPHRPLDLTLKHGRLAAFATIYKKWR